MGISKSSYSVCRRPSRRAGFTLLELIAVMGIMVTMMAMLVPAASSILQQKGRKAAVNMLLNTFEQARVLALENSMNVYVGFADANIPSSSVGQRNEGFPYTRFIVFRDSDAETDGANPPPYIALTKWLKLPDGISFKSGASTVADASSGGLVEIHSADRFPAVFQDYSMPVLKFNSAGMIEIPAASLRLFIYEGYFAGADVFTRANNNSLFERITFSRYTGRAELDITNLETH